MNDNYKIYVHKNKLNGKIYIGQTKQDVSKRWLKGEGYRTQSYFYNAIKKYGWDNFEHIILFDGLTVEEANLIEEFLIKKYNTTDRNFGYNRKFGGENYKVNEDARKRMSSQHANVCGKNNPHYGKTHSEETKKRISKIKKEKYSGKNHPNYGKHLSEKTKIKISNTKKKKVEMYNLDMEFIKSFPSIKEASKITGANKDCISMCCNNKLKTSGGYIWKYAS